MLISDNSRVRKIYFLNNKKKQEQVIAIHDDLENILTIHYCRKFIEKKNRQNNNATENNIQLPSCPRSYIHRPVSFKTLGISSSICKELIFGDCSPLLRDSVFDRMAIVLQLPNQPHLSHSIIEICLGFF